MLQEDDDKDMKAQIQKKIKDLESKVKENPTLSAVKEQSVLAKSAGTMYKNLEDRRTKLQEKNSKADKKKDELVRSRKKALEEEIERHNKTLQTLNSQFDEHDIRAEKEHKTLQEELEEVERTYKEKMKEIQQAQSKKQEELAEASGNGVAASGDLGQVLAQATPPGVPTGRQEVKVVLPVEAYDPQEVTRRLGTLAGAGLNGELLGSVQKMVEQYMNEQAKKVVKNLPVGAKASAEAAGLGKDGPPAKKVAFNP